MRGWMNYAGAALLILMGVFLYSWDSDVPTAGTPILALPLVVLGIVWGALAARRMLAATGEHGGERHDA